MEKRVLSSLLLRYMAENDLDKKAFAKQLGVTRQTLDNWLERDNNTVQTAFQMLEAMGYDLASLLEEPDIVIPQSLARRLTREDKLELVRLARLLAEKNP